MNKFLRRLFFFVSRNELIYRIARRLVYDHDGENNHDMLMNGEMGFLRQHLGNCKVIFDVGANIGEWTKIALSINQNIQIYCFEPSKDTFEKLTANNFPANVFCHNFGFGSEKGVKNLYIFEKGSAINSLYKRELMGASPKKEEDIYIDTIDGYCVLNNINEIDFLKVDVEGHELEVLKGASKMLRGGKIRIIQFEYGGTYIDAGIFLKDIFKFFGGLNYGIFKIFPDGIKRIERYNAGLENFQYVNYAAIHDDCHK